MFECSHDKGMPDAIGGILKRKADDMVNHGTHLPNATILCDVPKAESSVTLFLVDKEQITVWIECVALI